MPSETKVGRLAPFGYSNFVLLWTGALLSFSGSWIQNVAQGWLVYELTNDKAKLTFVSFCGMLPVSLFGTLAGSITDMFNKRLLLNCCQAIFGINALFIAWNVANHTIAYWQILTIAVINGFVSAVEMPARQSLISKVVPKEVLPSAIPLQALTFNSARIVGPAIGGLLLERFGANANYLVNGFSYAALIIAVSSMTIDMSATRKEREPIKDLLFEGMLYVMREPRLKLLFLLETTVSVFGLAYIPLLPALAKDVLRLRETGLGNIYSAIGVGAILALLTLTYLSNRKIKAFLVLTAMTGMGVGLILLSFAQAFWVAAPILALIGASAIMQFNTTNTCFQVLAPERLRGRVLAMHIWALSGSAPIALMLFGYVANHSGVQIAIRMGGILVFVGALLGWSNRAILSGVDAK